LEKDMKRAKQVEIDSCKRKEDIQRSISRIIDTYIPVSSNPSQKLLIKPNLNASMNALTGNTTDLRLLSSVIVSLKDRGYRHITIGEGTNSGYYRNKISVITRLRVDALAKTLDVKVKDLNYSEPIFIPFENGIRAGISKDCLEADLMINMPKLKTHFEAGMSVCLKNLMGCLVGQENKKKTHRNLAENILHINEYLKPHLHIVDGLIAMEGLGPTRGIPVHMGLILAGQDPLLIDLLCAHLALFDYKKIPTLKLAEERGLLKKGHHDIIKSLEIEQYKRSFLPPVAGLAARLIHSPKRQKYFLAIRNTPFFNYLCSTKMGGKILFQTGLRQDVFIEDEMRLGRLSLSEQRCSRCMKCSDYCPVGIKLPENLESDRERCIECLYCFMVCPEKAIDFEGELGFVKEQLRQYDEVVRKIA
jgi:uncharacterized protein (DUF362 family)/ferredoxin